MGRIGKLEVGVFCHPIPSVSNFGTSAVRILSGLKPVIELSYLLIKKTKQSPWYLRLDSSLFQICLVLFHPIQISSLSISYASVSAPFPRHF